MGNSAVANEIETFSSPDLMEMLSPRRQADEGPSGGVS